VLRKKDVTGAWIDWTD